MGPFLSVLFKTNRLTDGAYAEPYAGGAGAAFYLLFRGYASRIHLNDIDVAIYSFWKAVLNQTERFLTEISKVPLTIQEWDRQKEIYRSSREGFDLGFAFFYLNRTNRSGIMNAGVIGGRSQTSKWNIDARFNRSELTERVRAIGRMRRHISVTRIDALDFLDELQQSKPKDILVYLDPPYYAKGRELYTNFYTPEDHKVIAERLHTFELPWLLTYDDCPQIRALYEDCQLLESELSYSAREVRRGREIVVFSDSLQLPPLTSKASKGKLGFKVLPNIQPQSQPNPEGTSATLYATS